MTRYAGLLGLLGAACATPPNATNPADPVQAIDTAASDTVTYHRDVRPILEANCVSCHAQGTIAPFRLDQFEDARHYSGIVALATAERVMPPTSVDASGACNTYADAPWLTDDEIEVLDAWDRAGAPEGNVDDYVRQGIIAPLELTPFVDLEMPEPYAPNTAYRDDYRCFVLDPHLEEDLIVTGYEVVPGNLDVVHHVILFGMNTAEGDDEIRALDAQDEGPGYQCFGGAGTSEVLGVGGWAPGTGAVRYPDNSGVRVHAGRLLVMQVHYNSERSHAPDQTSVVLEGQPCRHDIPLNSPFVPVLCTDPMEGWNIPVAVWELTLAPGLEQARAVETYRFGDYVPVALNLHSFNPHMHRRGRRLTVTAIRSGRETCVADAPYYDFHWQKSYSFTQPFRVNTDADLRVECVFDTRDDQQPVYFGEGTDDEMCIGFFYATF
jgi:hypothetical protein